MGRLHRWIPCAIALCIGLLLRLALWDNLPRQGFMSDEAEYLAAASWLAQGRGFSWYQQWLWTRAPLYPLFLATHIHLAGLHLTPIYITQTLLSLINIGLIYAITLQASTRQTGNTPVSNDEREGAQGRTAAFVAALLSAIYFPLATYPQMLLSETLYLTLLLSAWALLGNNSIPARLLAAFVLGLATLTRGLTLGFLPIIVGWLWWTTRRPAQQQPLSESSPTQTHPRTIRLTPLLFALIYSLTIAPWSLYASSTYGGTIIIDTTSTYNLLLGARTAAGEAGNTQTRTFVQALLDPQLSDNERRTLVTQSCLLEEHDPRLHHALEQPVTTLSQAKRQQLITAEATCLLRNHAGAFVLKGSEELVRFFQINYTGAERMTAGFALGRVPRWYTLALFALDDTLYILILPMAVIGWGVARRTSLKHLTGLWWLYIVLTAPLLFAINRFRLPLVPFLCIYAASGIASLLVPYLNRKERKERKDRTAKQVDGASLPEHGSTRNMVLVRMNRLPLFIALVLALISITPYAYLQAPPASWASYLGPYPSSLDSTRIAWQTRPNGLREEHLIAALGRGDSNEARNVLASGPILERTTQLAQALIAGLDGQPARGLAMLPDAATIAETGDWRASVVRGDLLRRMGDEDEAKAAFTPGFVDDHNPVAWAWDWLAPSPTRRVDLAGNLDLGYIKGFYLGEGDPSAGGTFRWSEPEALVRFPGQGSTQAQHLCLRADGRGIPNDMPSPSVHIFLKQSTTATAHETYIASLNIQRNVQEYCAPLPATEEGSNIVIVVRTSPFVPNALDLLGQQGPQTGQVRLLGVRLDWVEVRRDETSGMFPSPHKNIFSFVIFSAKPKK